MKKYYIRIETNEMNGFDSNYKQMENKAPSEFRYVGVLTESRIEEFINIILPYEIYIKSSVLEELSDEFYQKYKDIIFEI